MRALMLQRVGVLEIVDLPEPEPAMGEVVVDVAAAGVCGSDVHSARDGGLMRTPPLVMGHEFSGTVAGRRVAVHPFISCGACGVCARGDDQLCQARQIVGIQRAGGFAERVAVPAGALVDLPESVSLEAGALAEPLAVALHAVRLCPMNAETRLGLLGAGAIGLMVLWLRAGQVGHLTVADPDASRRVRADELGADVISHRLESECDVIIDAVGTADTHQASIRYLRPGGTAVWVGNASPHPDFDAQDLVRTGKHVIGSAAYNRAEFREAAGRLDNRMLSWVSAFSLGEGPSIVRMLMDPASSTRPVKAVLRP